MKVTFLTHSLDGIGGTIRATLNTATALSDLGCEVEIAAVFKHHDTPLFALDPRVKVTTLVDRTRLARRPAAVTSLRDRVRGRLPSRVYPAGDTRRAKYSVLTDRRVAEFMRGCDADVIVGTRPGLNVYVSRFAPRAAAAVAQEHLFFDHHKPELIQALSDAYRHVDAVVTVSEADAANYRRQMPHLASKVSFIPNSIVPTSLSEAGGDNKLIVAAGRIENSKRFDMLIDAFAKVHTRHPDWKLRIYGHGKRTNKLRKTVDRHSLHNAVSLMGQRTPLDAEWVKGSIAAMTSKYESFGLTLVEAMNAGLPVVSTACHYGPPEIVSHGVDGLLTPLNDVDAFADALCLLIEDDALRKRMSVAAQVKSRSYLPEAVGASYARLFARLTGRAEERTPPQGLLVPAGGPPLGRGGSSATSGGTAYLDAVSSPAEHRRLTADCTSRSFDEVVVSLSKVIPGGCLDLVDVAHAPVSLPVTCVGGRSVVRMRRETLARLPEGVWRAWVYGAPVPAGHIDSRELLRPLGALPTSVVVPFSMDGVLAFRVWRRESYAEVDEVTWRGDSMRVAGRLLGVDWSTSAVSVVARRRSSRAATRFAAELDGAGRFAIDVPSHALAEQRRAKRDLWDLWLADDAGEHAPVRLSKFFDDVAERKPLTRFAAAVAGSPRESTVRPYFTVDNELSISVAEPARKG